MARISRQLVKAVAQRAQGACEYCRLPEAATTLIFQPHHVIVTKHEGKSDLSNLAWSCFYCNSYKGPNIAGIDPVSGKLTRLFHPRTDAWDQHFEWKGTWLRGKTPVGRTTVHVLNINHMDMVSLRTELKREGML